jgi:hypothetical protein
VTSFKRSFLVVFHLYSARLGLPPSRLGGGAGGGGKYGFSLCFLLLLSHTLYNFEREISHMTRVKVEGKSRLGSGAGGGVNMVQFAFLATIVTRYTILKERLDT